MPTVEVPHRPPTTHAEQLLDEQTGQLRLGDLEDDWPHDTTQLYHDLVDLAKDGKLKLYPIGNVVKIEPL